MWGCVAFLCRFFVSRHKFVLFLSSYVVCVVFVWGKTTQTFSGYTTARRISLCQHKPLGLLLCCVTTRKQISSSTKSSLLFLKWRKLRMKASLLKLFLIGFRLTAMSSTNLESELELDVLRKSTIGRRHGVSCFRTLKLKLSDLNGENYFVADLESHIPCSTTFWCPNVEKPTYLQSFPRQGFGFLWNSNF